MAKKTETITTTIDDLDGLVIESGAETIRFSIDNATYEIDLSAQNAKSLRDALEPYVKVARSVSTMTRRASSGAKSNKEELDALRSWAKENGLAVSDRGRVSAEIREAYAKAH